MNQPTPPRGDVPHPFWVKWQIMLSWRQGTLTFIAALTLARLWLLFVSPFDLGPDEAQYWSWSRDFAFGYFSKPPMIGWIIGLTTAACGVGEACVRLAAPLLHAFTATMLFFLVQKMFDDRLAFWTSVLFLTLPGVWFSSGLITTDVPLLFFWSASLYALWSMRENASLKWAVMLGIGIGLGLMSKYAMLYFIGGAVLACLFDRPTRAALLSRYGLVVAALAMAIFAPNIWWNAANDFSTVTHTAANANVGPGVELFNLDELADFVGGQFGIFGPFLFGGLVFAIASFISKARRHEAIDSRFLWLASFVVPALVAGMTIAFVSRANANWAATAYVAGTPLAVAWLFQSRARALLPASFFLHNFAGLMMVLFVVAPSLISTLHRENDFKRVRGWEEIGKIVEVSANAGREGTPYSAVLTNDRLTYAELLYYAPDLTVPLTMWDANGIAENHFELTASFGREHDGQVLLVARGAGADQITTQFAQVEELELLSVEIGGGRTREYRRFIVSGLLNPAE